MPGQQILPRIVNAFVAALLVMAAFTIGQKSFDKVLDYRALERIPISKVTTSIGSEVKLKGRVVSTGDTLFSPETDRPTVYFYYLIEESFIDDDGFKQWQVVDTQEQGNDFLVSDSSGNAIVRVQNNFQDIDWLVEKKYQVERDGYRYTEWRLDVDDIVTLSGWLDWINTGLVLKEAEVSFDKPGDYLPIISNLDDIVVLTEWGWDVVGMLFISITLLIFAGYFFVKALLVHRVLVYLTIISIGTGLFLFQYGWSSLQIDVDKQYQNYLSQRERAQKLINEVLGSTGEQWDWNSPVVLIDRRYAKLSAEQKSQIHGWRLGAIASLIRYQQLIDQFPENWYAALTGQSEVLGIYWSSEEQSQINKIIENYQRARIDHPGWVSMVAIVFMILAAWCGFRAIRMKRIIENIPTSKTTEVVFGQTEIVGIVEPEDEQNLLRAPLSGCQCVWYRYLIMQKQGDNEIQRWVTVTEITKGQPFFCRDEDGRIRVYPDQAEMILKKHHLEKTKGDWRYIESRMDDGDKLYLLGSADIDPASNDQLAIQADEAGEFVISDQAEHGVVFLKGRKGIIMLGVSVAVMFGALLLNASRYGGLSSFGFVSIAFAAPVYLSIFILIIKINDLMFLRQRCHKAWENIQLNIQQRSKLLLNIEGMLLPVIDHERSLQHQLAELRHKQSNILYSDEADDYLQQEYEMLEHLRIRTERYPNLVGAETLNDLQKTFVKVDNEMALLRRDFNEAATQYNKRIHNFPDKLLAKILGFSAIRMLTFRSNGDKSRNNLVDVK